MWRFLLLWRGRCCELSNDTIVACMFLGLFIISNKYGILLRRLVPLETCSPINGYLQATRVNGFVFSSLLSRSVCFITILTSNTPFLEHMLTHQAVLLRTWWWAYVKIWFFNNLSLIFGHDQVQVQSQPGFQVLSGIMQPQVLCGYSMRMTITSCSKSGLKISFQRPYLSHWDVQDEIWVCLNIQRELL